MAARTGTVTIRNVTYTVTELNGKQMKACRKLLDNPDTKAGLESMVTYFGTVSPKFASIEEVDQLPQVSIEAISAKVFALAKEPDDVEGGERPEA